MSACDLQSVGEARFEPVRSAVPKRFQPLKQWSLAEEILGVWFYGTIFGSVNNNGVWANEENNNVKGLITILFTKRTRRLIFGRRLSSYVNVAQECVDDDRLRFCILLLN